MKRLYPDARSRTRPGPLVLRRWRANMLYALLCFIWGSTWLAIKVGLNGVPPTRAAAIRMLIAGSLLLSVALVLRTPFPRTRIFALQVLVQGTSQFGFNFALVYWSEQFIPSGLAAVLFAVAPIVTALSAAFIFRIERLAPINIAGLVLGFAGVAVIYWAEVVHAAQAPAPAVLAVLAASTIVSNASVFAKRWNEHFAPLAIVSGGQVCGGVVLALLAFLTERNQPMLINTASLGALAYLTVFGSAIAFLTYFYLLRSVPVTTLSLVPFITPVLAIFLGALALHETLAPTTFIGAGLIFLGISFVHRKSHVAQVLAASSTLSLD